MPNSSNEAAPGAAAPASEPVPMAAAAEEHGSLLNSLRGVDGIEIDGDSSVHISNAFGLTYISYCASEGFTFGTSEVYYLDQSISIECGKQIWDPSEFSVVFDSPIGTENSPFVSTFDGQGNTITFISNIDDPEQNPTALFGTLCSCTIKNLNIEWDVQGSFDHFYGLFDQTVEGSVVNVSHLSMSGNIEITYTYGFALFGCNSHLVNDTINLYDVNINMQKFINNGGTNMDSILGSYHKNMDINSCKIELQNVSSHSNILSIYGMDGGINLNVSNSKLAIHAVETGSIIAFLNMEQALSKATFHESQIEIIVLNGSVNMFASIYTNDQIELYDCAFITNSSSTFSGNTTNHYCGVYTFDGTTTTILDPNFTSYKWCQDTHLNNALPQLRRFVSIGDFMEQCDMKAWIASLK